MDAKVETAWIEINGRREPLVSGSLTALLEERGIDAAGRGVAIAVNGAVLPRAAWPTTRLRSGDAVEIVQAKQGG
ncbi:MAG TPA: sulfur carrier protein ThiS [Xanthobacteraceae bacterium]|jgi:sulfur carrier protein